VRIAVTGGIACGKTLVGSFLAQAGVAVCEADTLAHELMKPGMTVYKKVVSEFGKDILLRGRRDQSEALGDVSSRTRARLAALNAIVS